MTTAGQCEESLGSEEFPHFAAHLSEGVGIQESHGLDAQLFAEGAGLFHGTLEVLQLGMLLFFVLLPS